MINSDGFDPEKPLEISGAKPLLKKTDFDPDKPIQYTPPISTFSAPWWEDVGTQAVTGLGLGAGDIVALPATAAQGVGYVGNKLRTGVDYYREMTGSAPKGAAKINEAARVKAAQAAMPESERKGLTANVFGYQAPTSEGMEDIIRNTLDLGKAPAQTTTGRYVGAGFRAVPLTVATMGGGLIPRVGYGLATGMGAEAGHDVGEATGLPGAGITGALIGGLGGTAAMTRAGNVLRPGLAGQRELANSVARDVAGGKSSLPGAVDALGTPRIAGTTVGEAAYGPNARQVIGRAGGSSERALNELEGINQGIVSRSGNINENLGQFVKKTTGVSDDAPELLEAVGKEGAARVSRVYDVASRAPAAQNLQSPDLTKALQGNTMAAIARRVDSIATDPSSPIVVAATAANGSRTGGNLLYYDQIGKMLRDDIEVALRSGAKEEARRLTTLRTDMLKAVDAAVPEYNVARAAAFDNFAQQGAIDLGYKSLATRDLFDIHEITNAFRASAPRHQELFKQGLGYALQNAAQEGGPGALNKILSSPSRGAFLEKTLGAPAIAAIRGRAKADALLAAIKPYQPMGQTASRVTDIARGGIGSEFLRAGASGDIGSAATAAMAYGATNVLDVVRGFSGDRKAMAILKLAGSSDPKDMQMFYRMVKNDPAAQTTIRKIIEAARANALRATVSNAQETTPPEQSSGGRIERKAGGKVSDAAQHERLVGRLMGLADKAKRGESATTKPLLNAPDEAIVKALSIANAAI